MDIVEIELWANNLKEAEFFYTKILGLHLIHKSEEKISLQVGASTISFINSSQLNPTYHFAFNIPCNKLEDAIFWSHSKFDLLENIENGVITHFESWNAKAIYFYDNNGNILEFIARFDLLNDETKNFTIDSIQCISEIGIVTEFPKKLSEKLHKKYNIPYFSKGAQSNKFSILGDDFGLLIIVESQRVWYPTNLKAEKFYTKIKFQQDSVLHELILNE